MTINSGTNGAKKIRNGTTNVAVVVAGNEITWPIGTLVYSNDFTGTDRDLTSDGWVDHSYSTGTYQIFQGRLVPSGMANYRTFNTYYYNTALSSIWQFARVKVYTAPAAADPRGGIGLVLRHDGTTGIFFKVSTNGSWYAYYGDSNSSTTSDPTTTALGSGSLPRAVVAGDELIAFSYANTAKFFLNNIHLGSIDIAKGPKGLYTGVTISQNNSGELSNFRTGILLSDPTNGAFVDRFASLSSFTQTSTGSGIVATSSEAAWTGGTDGTATALYNSSATSSNQYAACTVGSVVHSSRASGLITHCDDSLISWYGALFEGDRIALVTNTGRWLQNIGGPNDINYSEWTGTVSPGDVIEMWNIGERFIISHNGTVRIDYTISGANIGSSQRRVGFGMIRQSFGSSSRLADWWGGDAEAWDKT